MVNLRIDIGNSMMNRKRKTYSADFKAKLVLELLEGEKTVNEVASKYEVLPKSLQEKCSS